MTAGEVQRDETELVSRARAGDRDAFGELIWRHQDAVYTLAHRLVGPDLAPDVTQEALIRAWRSMAGFRGDASFATWLHRITVNTAWTQRRRALRHEARPLDDALVDTGLADGGTTPEHAGEMVDVRAALRAAIARHFGVWRALGGDHFRDSYRQMTLVKEGAFKYSSNAMYVFAFLVFWSIALLSGSRAALALALFQHAYIWVHMYCTEGPDMRVIYGSGA